MSDPRTSGVNKGKIDSTITSDCVCYCVANHCLTIAALFGSLRRKKERKLEKHIREQRWHSHRGQNFAVSISSLHKRRRCHNSRQNWPKTRFKLVQHWDHRRICRNSIPIQKKKRKKKIEKQEKTTKLQESTCLEPQSLRFGQRFSSKRSPK